RVHCVLLFASVRPRFSLFPYTTLFRSTSPIKRTRSSTFGCLFGCPCCHLISHHPILAVGLARFAATAAPTSMIVRLCRECRHSLDRKSTRLNSSHDQTSYAVCCL